MSEVSDILATISDLSLFDMCVLRKLSFMGEVALGS
jgi:hypothetical protein